MKEQNIMGENLKAFRERAGLSQEEVASYLGISHTSISYYEKGSREISLKHLEKLADLFGIELADFLEEEDIQKNVNAAFAFRKESLSTQDLEGIASFRRIVKNYVKLTNIEKKHALKVSN